MRFLRAVLSAVLITTPILVVLLIPPLVRDSPGGPGLASFGATLLNVMFVAAVILIPRVNGWLDPEVPDWTASTAMASAARVWRTRLGFALLAVLALLVVYAAGQTAAYLLGQAATTDDPDASTPGFMADYGVFFAQEMVVYVFGFVAGLTTYLLIVRALVRPDPDAKPRRRR